MTPTNEQLSEVVKLIGKHVFEMDRLVLAMCESHDSRGKFLAATLPSLTDDQRETLRAAASQSETALEQLEAAIQRYHADIEQCPFWK
jgi:hypothetical protein